MVVIFFFGYACPSCIAISPDIQSGLADKYKNNQDFLIVGIDAWDGNLTQVNNFITSSKLDFEILQKGSKIAQSWGTTYDRIAVVDQTGNLFFKGGGLVSSHLTEAIDAVESALQSSTSTSNKLTLDGTENFKLFPNPVASSAYLTFSLESEANVAYSVYNIAGKLVFESNTEHYPPGQHTLSVLTDGLQSGIHLLRLKVGDHVMSQRFTVKI